MEISNIHGHLFQLIIDYFFSLPHKDDTKCDNNHHYCPNQPIVETI